MGTGLVIHGITAFPWANREKHEFVLMWIILNSHLEAGGGGMLNNDPHTKQKCQVSPVCFQHSWLRSSAQQASRE